MHIKGEKMSNLNSSVEPHAGSRIVNRSVIIGGAILVAAAIGVCIYCCNLRGDGDVAGNAKAKTAEMAPARRVARSSHGGRAVSGGETATRRVAESESVSSEDRRKQIEERRKVREARLRAREEERKARKEAREKSPEKQAFREREEQKRARREALRLRDEYENAMDDEMREHYRRLPVGYWRHRVEERKRRREEFRKRHGLDVRDRDPGDGRDSSRPDSDDLAVEGQKQKQANKE